LADLERIEKGTEGMSGRREFLLAAGALGMAGAVPALAAEAPPETRRIRINRTAALCFAPLFVAGEGLLQAEGFSEISYEYRDGSSGASLIVDGEADFGASDISTALVAVEKSQNLVVLGGMHAGCYELFTSGEVASIRDLKGRKVAIPGLHSGRHLTMSAMLAHVGVDANKDVNWVTHPPADSMRLLAEGKVDAYLGFPPEPQELRAKKIGRLIVSMTTDRPWSEHYCCVFIARREYVKANPVATKRALRAFLKATSICTSEPERATRVLIERKLTDKYDYALQMMKELPFSRWRDYDPMASLRFYALRLHEAGLIRTTPQKLIAQGSNFRFIDELKKELKA
jgi:NitT/TauT family transport system substrate-binding protein